MCVNAWVCVSVPVPVCVRARLYVAYLTGQATIYGAFAWTETAGERKRNRPTHRHTRRLAHATIMIYIWFWLQAKQQSAPSRDHSDGANLLYPPLSTAWPDPSQLCVYVCVCVWIVFAWMSAGAFTITLSYNNIYVRLCARRAANWRHLAPGSQLCCLPASLGLFIATTGDACKIYDLQQNTRDSDNNNQTTTKEEHYNNSNNNHNIDNNNLILSLWGDPKTLLNCQSTQLVTSYK